MNEEWTKKWGILDILYLGGGFNMFFMFTPIWGNDPFIFFKWVAQPPTSIVLDISDLRDLPGPRISKTSFSESNPPGDLKIRDQTSSEDQCLGHLPSRSLTVRP